jgi:hypothetical protein
MDINIQRGHNMVRFTGWSDCGLAWLRKQLLTEPWQWDGRAVTVDHRAAERLRELAEADGLEITEGVYNPWTGATRGVLLPGYDR